MNKEEYPPPQEFEVSEAHHKRQKEAIDGFLEEKGKEIDDLREQEYREKVIREMRDLAFCYEKQAISMFMDWDLHKAHSTMENARSLRQAANIMDNTCCNGG